MCFNLSNFNVYANGVPPRPPPKAEQLLPKFHGLVLRLEGLIDANGIDVAQSIWP